MRAGRGSCHNKVKFGLKMLLKATNPPTTMAREPASARLRRWDAWR